MQRCSHPLGSPCHDASCGPPMVSEASHHSAGLMGRQIRRHIECALTHSRTVAIPDAPGADFRRFHIAFGRPPEQHGRLLPDSKTARGDRLDVLVLYGTLAARYLTLNRRL